MRENKVTVWRAAEIAGIDYRSMLEELRVHRVPFPLSARDLKRELDEHARKTTLPSSKRLKIVKLKGLWKGLKVDEEDTIS